MCTHDCVEFHRIVPIKCDNLEPLTMALAKFYVPPSLGKSVRDFRGHNFLSSVLLKQRRLASQIETSQTSTLLVYLHLNFIYNAPL